MDECCGNCRHWGNSKEPNCGYCPIRGMETIFAFCCYAFEEG